MDKKAQERGQSALYLFFVLAIFTVGGASVGMQIFKNPALTEIEESLKSPKAAPANSWIDTVRSR